MFRHPAQRDAQTIQRVAAAFPTTVTAPDGTQTITQTNGLVSTFTDARENVTTTRNDVWGRVASIEPPTGPSVAYTYDELNRIKTVTRGGATTNLYYDAAGRKTAMSDPDMGNWSYTYDALGNLKTQTDARGCVLTLSYDNLNRLTNKSSSGAGCGTQVNTSYTYDVGPNGIGRRTGMTDASSSSFWSYDARGHLKTETVMGYTTEWEYNAADMPIRMTYPDGEEVTYGYDARMLLNTLAGDSTYVTSTAYDSTGRIDLRTFGNSTRTDYGYYPWTAEGGRLQYLKSGTAGSPTSLQDLSYAYDAVGNIETITNTLASETNSYGYDALNRLTSWTLNGVTENYGYNSATGNLETKAGVTLQYNDAAHVHAVTSASDQSTVNSYQYDANGNQTTRVIGSDTFTLLYDAENRLVEVKKNSVSIATFVYDGDGKRVKSIIGSETTLFIGSHYEVTNGVATKYYLAGTSRIAMRKDGTLSYFLSDHLGSTSLTTDSTGSLMFEQRYKPWGETRYTTPNASAVSEYQYTGQFSDSYINLLWYGSRHYDPALGRFISPDSIVPGLDNPQAWDRFSYTFNNPVRYVDPDGHNPIPLIILLIVGAVALTADNPLPDISAPVREAINEIKGSAPTDADALVTMFTTDNLPGNTPTERLNVILDATSNGPFAHFEILGQIQVETK